MATSRYNFRLPLRDEASLKLFLRVSFGVELPDQAVCPGHTSPWRFFADAFFGRHRTMVLKASRGLSGKSFLLAHLGLCYAICQKASATLLGGSGEQSRNLHRYMVDAWAHQAAPRYLLASDPLKMQTTLTNGASIRALLASSTSVRGPHPQKLLIDEADECDLEVFLASLGQPMGKGTISPQTIIASTHHYPDGTFSEILKLAGQKDWHVAEFCYKETLRGWLDPAEVEAKKADVPAQMFAIEYDLQAPSFEGRAIMEEAIFAMFDPELGTFEGRDAEYIEVEPPQPGATYQTGADWARKADNTVILTVRTDVDPLVIVAFERLHRRPWPQMVSRFEQRLRRYPGEARHDGTGLGDVVDGYLSVSAEGVLLTGRTRSDLFSDYISLIERGGIISPDIKFMHNEHQYCTVDDLYGRGHPPDTIVAASLSSVPSGRPRWLPIGT